MAVLVKIIDKCVDKIYIRYMSEREPKPKPTLPSVKGMFINERGWERGLKPGLYAIAWMTLLLMTHPVRTIKEVLYLGEYRMGFDPKTHRPNSKR